MQYVLLQTEGGAVYQCIAATGAVTFRLPDGTPTELIGPNYVADANPVPPAWDAPEVAPQIAQPVEVPQSVSRFQAMVVLYEAGLLNSINAYMKTADPIKRLAWENAQEFVRSSAMVADVAQIFNLTDDQIDALFIQAGGVNA